MICSRDVETATCGGVAVWKILTKRESSGVLFRLLLSSLGVLLDVALEVDLGTLWKKALTTFLATATEAVTTSFGAHARAESVLAFAGAL